MLFSSGVVRSHETGFNMKTVKYLVLDEADRLLNMDFEAELDEILRSIPREQRRSLMFSATMTSKVAKLQRACLTDPVKVCWLAFARTGGVMQKLPCHYSTGGVDSGVLVM